MVCARTQSWRVSLAAEGALLAALLGLGSAVFCSPSAKWKSGVVMSDGVHSAWAEAEQGFHLPETLLVSRSQIWCRSSVFLQFLSCGRVL